MYSVKMRDGTTIHEFERDWKLIDHKDIVSIRLIHGDTTYTLDADGANGKVLQLKRALVSGFSSRGINPMDNGVTERVIGFVFDDFAVKLEVDEKSGNARLVIEKKEGKKWVRL